MHIVTKAKDVKKIKRQIREELEKQGICHAILETEEEACEDIECKPNLHIEKGHHHHD